MTYQLTGKQAHHLDHDVGWLDGSAQLLIVQGAHNDMSFDAQKYLGTVEGVKHLALVVHSRLQAEVARFLFP